MLQKDPRARITPTQILSLPWVSGGGAPAEALPGSDERLKQFNAARRVWRTAAGAVALVIGAPHTAAAISANRAASPGAAAAHSEAGGSCWPVRPHPLPRAALEEMTAAFRAFDADGDGFIDQVASGRCPQTCRRPSCALTLAGAASDHRIFLAPITA
jgi:hypothetical protein